ncbi:hypothetical protein [Paracraurococcus ruber]|uniref:MAPEG family protein n=1 Tax=Paracraurococcus ruber TaxID=77675 RepID=A0ABS1CSJ3_9PROT|nr:hypothetical protein [Paracraurococcus ruber]MBK1657431.1 hypothetical protein [Paracraurococcus ruber]TDG33861.1 hypothetical protein E2C05_02325 [Paracraurococcus ruber]
MPATAALPSRPHPGAAIPDRLGIRTPADAVDATIVLGAAPYWIWFWLQGSQFHGLLISHAVLLWILMRGIRDIGRRYPERSLTLASSGVFACLFVLWKVLFTDVARH